MILVTPITTCGPRPRLPTFHRLGGHAPRPGIILVIIITCSGPRLRLPTVHRPGGHAPRPGITFVIMALFWSRQAHHSSMQAMSRKNNVHGAICPRRTLARRLAGQSSRSHALGINGGGALPKTERSEVVVGTLPVTKMVVLAAGPFQTLPGGPDGVVKHGEPISPHVDSRRKAARMVSRSKPERSSPEAAKPGRHRGALP